MQRRHYCRQKTKITPWTVEREARLLRDNTDRPKFGRKGEGDEVIIRPLKCHGWIRTGGYHMWTTLVNTPRGVFIKVSSSKLLRLTHCLRGVSFRPSEIDRLWFCRSRCQLETKLGQPSRWGCPFHRHLRIDMTRPISGCRRNLQNGGG